MESNCHSLDIHIRGERQLKMTFRLGVRVTRVFIFIYVVSFY